MMTLTARTPFVFRNDVLLLCKLVDARVSVITDINKLPLQIGDSAKKIYVKKPMIR